MAKKYLTDEEGLVRAVTSSSLQLEKPLLNDNYDIEVHNRNMDKIDSAIHEVKGKVDGLELTAERVSIADPTNKFEATNVEDALLENKTSILNNTSLANQALTKANEAFQRGDEVKTQLVDKLISEGLDVSTNNTFEELISYISIGKKWASGTTNPTKSKNFIMGTGVARSSMYIEIPELEFTPSLMVAVACYQTDTNYISVLSTTETQIYKPQVVSATCSTYISSDMTTCTWKVDANVFSDGKYHIPVTPVNLETTWIAYE